MAERKHPVGDIQSKTAPLAAFIIDNGIFRTRLPEITFNFTVLLDE